MTPETDLEAIMHAYAGNRFDEISTRCVQMRKGIDADHMDHVGYILTTPQLSALLIMAEYYGKVAKVGQPTAPKNTLSQPLTPRG